MPESSRKHLAARRARYKGLWLIFVPDMRSVSVRASRHEAETEVSALIGNRRREALNKAKRSVPLANKVFIPTSAWIVRLGTGTVLRGKLQHPFRGNMKFTRWM